MTSPVADCANCQPVIHPYRSHKNGGMCTEPDCSCMEFKPIDPLLRKLTHCYICGRPTHANGVCPYATKAKF